MSTSARGWSPCTEWPESATTWVRWNPARRSAKAAASSSLTKYELAPRTSVVGIVIGGTSSHRSVEPVALAERVVAPRPRAVVELLAVVEHAAAQRLPVAVRRGGDGHVEHRRERRETAVALHQRDGAHLRLGHLLVAVGRRRRDVDEHQLRNQVGLGGGDAQRGQPAERHADHQPRRRCPLAQHRPQRLGAELRPVVAVLAPCGSAVPGQVDRQRGYAESEDDGVPGVGVLSAAVQEDHLRRGGTPLDGADPTGRRCARRQAAGPSRRSVRRSRPAARIRRGPPIRRRRCPPRFDPTNPRKFGCAHACGCATVERMAATTTTGLTIRTAQDADWPAMALLAAASFGVVPAAGDDRHVADADARRRCRRRLRRRRRRRHGVLSRSAS